MKQQLTVVKEFSDLSAKLNIEAVYQRDQVLIAVCKILPTGNSGEAISRRKASMTVQTNSDKLLPVQTIFLGHGQTLANLEAIKGLAALPQVLSAQGRMYAKKTKKDSDAECSDDEIPAYTGTAYTGL